jgi:hypothetical protein
MVRRAAAPPVLRQPFHLSPSYTDVPITQGFLFRFASNDVSPASKPRGIVDLSTVTDVSDGSATAGRPHSIKLSTATGHICYLCESETSQVGGCACRWLPACLLCGPCRPLACCCSMCWRRRRWRP